MENFFRQRTSKYDKQKQESGTSIPLYFDDGEKESQSDKRMVNEKPMVKSFPLIDGKIM